MGLWGSICILLVYVFKDDITIKTIFKNSRTNSYFENIQEGKNDDKLMIYNKNEKECWASIATLPSQVRSIIDHNREVVNEPDLGLFA